MVQSKSGSAATDPTGTMEIAFNAVARVDESKIAQHRSSTFKVSSYCFLVAPPHEHLAPSLCTCCDTGHKALCPVLMVVRCSGRGQESWKTNEEIQGCARSGAARGQGRCGCSPWRYTASASAVHQEMNGTGLVPYSDNYYSVAAAAAHAPSVITLVCASSGCRALLLRTRHLLKVSGVSSPTFGVLRWYV